MPKHAFSFPKCVRAAVREYVAKSVAAIDSTRYRQEPEYVASLLTRLEGTAYQGPEGHIELTPTIYNSLGPNSAEYRYGADFSLMASVSDRTLSIKKVILVQAKIGPLDKMDRRSRDQLERQILKMKKLVPAPKVMEIVERGGIRVPRIASANRFITRNSYTKVPLEDYVVRRVLTTLDGNTSHEVVRAVQDSRLSELRIRAKLLNDNGRTERPE
jgi:hypothetical protein